jgi:hypothetical protein
MVAIVASGDEALAWNQRALELAQASPDPDARRWRASLFNNLGWTYHDRGEYARWTCSSRLFLCENFGCLNTNRPLVRRPALRRWSDSGKASSSASWRRRRTNGGAQDRYVL